MANNETEKNEKVSCKTIKVESNIEFCGLPVETTETTLEKANNSKLTTCDKLIVQFDRVNSKMVYGKVSEKIEPNPDFIKLIPKFLEEIYKSKNADKTEENVKLTFDEWRDYIAFSKINTVTLMQRARNTALDVENSDLGNTLAKLETQLNAGKADADSIAKLQAMLDALKANVTA